MNPVIDSMGYVVLTLILTTMGSIAMKALSSIMKIDENTKFAVRLALVFNVVSNLTALVLALLLMLFASLITSSPKP